MQCVWKEGGCELNPLHNMWLLGTWAMFRSARKFGKSGTGLVAKPESTKLLLHGISKLYIILQFLYYTVK